MLQLAILWSVILAALYTDLRERKIYNIVVVPGALAGIMANVYLSGWSGLTGSLLGLVMGMGILFIPFALGGIGPGDVKLFGAIGAIMGASFAFHAALGTGVAGGVVAIILLIRQGRLLEVVRRVGVVLTSAALLKRPEGLKTLDQAEYHESFPYGVAIAIGVLLAMFVR